MQIHVDCYAGYRGEETPKRIRFGDRTVAVAKVLDRWLAPDHRYFKLAGNDGGLYIVRHDEATGTWELIFFSEGDIGPNRLSRRENGGPHN